MTDLPRNTKLHQRQHANNALNTILAPFSIVTSNEVKMALLVADIGRYLFVQITVNGLRIFP